MKEYSSLYFTLRNQKGLELTCSSLGAGVRRLYLQKAPLLLDLKNDEEYCSSTQFFGKTLGRVAGRTAKQVIIDGRVYPLEENEKGVCLHGGVYKGLSFQDFTPKEVKKPGYQGIEFTYLSKDGEAGYPGNLTTKVTYLLKDTDLEFTILYEAESDADTIVSLSNHMYWNLFCSQDVNDYHLFINASKVGSFKKGSLLLDQLVDVPSYLDFRSSPSLKDKLDELEQHLGKNVTLDNTYLFDKEEGKPDIILDTDYLTLQLFTDFEGTNIYVDSSKTPIEFHNWDGDYARERRAIALEPQCIPFLDHIYLRKGAIYSHKIVYRLIQK